MARPGHRARPQPRASPTSPANRPRPSPASTHFAASSHETPRGEHEQHHGAHTCHSTVVQRTVSTPTPGCHGVPFEDPLAARRSGSQRRSPDPTPPVLESKQPNSIEQTMTTRAEHQVTIDRPAEEVFAFLANGANNLRWQPPVIETTQIDPTLGVNTRFPPDDAPPAGSQGARRLSDHHL